MKLFTKYLSKQIYLRDRFVFQSNWRISSSISHRCSFFYKLSNEATKMLHFENFEEKNNFRHAVHTQDGAKKLNLIFF